MPAAMGAIEGTLPTPGLVLVVIALATVALGAGGARMERMSRIRIVGALVQGGWLYCAIGVCLGPAGAHVLDAGRIGSVKPVIACLLALVGALAGGQCTPDALRAIPRRLAAWIAADTVMSCIVGACIAWGIVAVAGARAAGSAAAVPAGPLGIATLALGLAAVTCGWAPESRSLAVSAQPRAIRLAVLLQAGAGLAGLAALALASAVPSIVEVRDGTMGTVPLLGAPALAATAAAALVVSAVAWLLVRDVARDDARAIVTLFGALALVAGTASAAGSLPLLAGALLGACLARIGAETRPIAALAAASEPVAAAAIFLVAGTMIEPATLPIAAGAAAALAILRRLLKPALLRVMLRREREAIATELPLARASGRQSPMGMAVAVALSMALPDPIGPLLLSTAVLAGALSWILATLPRPSRASSAGGAIA